MEKEITISTTEYARLVRDSTFLDCLQACGVDNWDWYDEACKQFNQERGEE